MLFFWRHYNSFLLFSYSFPFILFPFLFFVSSPYSLFSLPSISRFIFCFFCFSASLASLVHSVSIKGFTRAVLLHLLASNEALRMVVFGASTLDTKPVRHVSLFVSLRHYTSFMSFFLSLTLFRFSYYAFFLFSVSIYFFLPLLLLLFCFFYCISFVALVCSLFQFAFSALFFPYFLLFLHFIYILLFSTSLSSFVHF